MYDKHVITIGIDYHSINDTHIMYSSVFYFIYQLVIFYRWGGEVSLWCFAWRY
jgi:hypothetical protein